MSLGYKGSDGIVTFLSASAAQTQDALHVIEKLDSRLSVCLIALNSAASGNRLEARKVARSQVQFYNIFTPLPASLGLLLQILKIRLALIRFISKHHRIVLVLGDDVCPAERSVVSLAKERGVPTIIVQDGILNDQQSWDQWLKARRSRAWPIKLSRKILHYCDLLPPLTMYGATECTKVAVWGEGTRDLMIGYGVDPEKIAITGSPRFDHWFTLAHDQPSVLKKSGSKYRLLFAALLLSNWKLSSFNEDCRTIVYLESLAQHEPQWEITVRPHPSERIENYLQIFKLLGVKKLKLDQQSSIASVLRDCDLFLTYHSTLALESMILGKPVICLPINPVQDPLYVREGAVIAMKNLVDLGGLIKTLLYDAKLRDEIAQRHRIFLSRHLGYTDGVSASRVAHLIESLL